MAEVQFITDFHHAELNAAKVMQSWGFTDATATTGGADGGIDVRASTALAQVKWKGGAAGRPDIQRLVGARGRDHTKQLFFFAASAYSKAAIEYADEVDVRLFLYDPVGNVEPANKSAHAFLGVGPVKQPITKKLNADTLWIAVVIVGICAGLFVILAVLTG